MKKIGLVLVAVSLFSCQKENIDPESYNLAGTHWKAYEFSDDWGLSWDSQTSPLNEFDYYVNFTTDSIRIHYYHIGTNNPGGEDLITAYELSGDTIKMYENGEQVFYLVIVNLTEDILHYHYNYYSPDSIQQQYHFRYHSL